MLISRFLRKEIAQERDTFNFLEVFHAQQAQSAQERSRVLQASLESLIVNTKQLQLLELRGLLIHVLL
jgi:hypothetical protein